MLRSPSHDHSCRGQGRFRRCVSAVRTARTRGGIFAVDPDNGQQSKVSASSVLTRPMGLAVAPDGRLIVAYHNQGNDLVVLSNGIGDFRFVLRFTAGDPEPATVSANGQLKSPFSVAVESTGQIVVADRSSGVIRIDPATGAQTVLAAGGSLESPIAVAIAR